MNPFEKISRPENKRRALSPEAAEAAAEQKEKQIEDAEKKMAAKERLEVTGREIKTTQNQIKNIVANMQQVVAAVAAIRAELGLLAPAGGANIPSVARDEKKLAVLKEKLSRLYGEIDDLKKALLAEELNAAKEEAPNAGADALNKEAARRVNEVLEKLGLAA